MNHHLRNLRMVRERKMTRLEMKTGVPMDKAIARLRARRLRKEKEEKMAREIKKSKRVTMVMETLILTILAVIAARIVMGM